MNGNAQPRSEYDGLAAKFFRSVAATIRYWMQTEVHVYAFSIAANVLLSFFPFLIVCVTLSRIRFNYQTTVAAIDFALRDYFPERLQPVLAQQSPLAAATEVARGLVDLAVADHG